MKLKLISEMPPTRFSQNLPRELALFANSSADLGFEDLGLPDIEFKLLNRAFMIKGVRVPGTNYKLRDGANTIIEPAAGDEPQLPTYWRETVTTTKDGQFIWIGKRVRQERIGKIDFSLYEDKGEGWLLIQTL